MNGDLTAIKELSSRLYGKNQAKALQNYVQRYGVADLSQLSAAQLLEVRRGLESVESRVTRYNRGRNY